MNTLFLINRRTLAIPLLALILAPFQGIASGWKSGETLPKLETFDFQSTNPEIEGKVVLIDFWASWCTPCKKSFPEMDHLYSKYKDQGFKTIAINVDDNIRDMERFLGRMNISFDIVHDASKQAVQSAGIDVIPSCFLIDRNGVIRLVHQGWHGKQSSEELSYHIEKLLEEDAQ